MNALKDTFHPECFLCVQCGKSVGSGAFHLEDGNIYCEKGKIKQITNNIFLPLFPCVCYKETPGSVILDVNFPLPAVIFTAILNYLHTGATNLSIWVHRKKMNDYL